MTFIDGGGKNRREGVKDSRKKSGKSLNPPPEGKGGKKESGGRGTSPPSLRGDRANPGGKKREEEECAFSLKTWSV